MKPGISLVCCLLLKLGEHPKIHIYKIDTFSYVSSSQIQTFGILPKAQ